MADKDLREQISDYLEDVHAAEQNGITQLEAGAKAVQDDQLKTVLQQHLEETRGHAQLISDRLEAYGKSPSTLKNVAAKGAAAVTGAISGAAPDTTGKIAIQSFANEHLEIASYRMLKTVAERAGDTETVAVAERILGEEEAAARKLDGLIERAALVGVPQAV